MQKDQKKNKSSFVSIRLERDLKIDLEMEATVENRPLAGYIRYLLMTHPDRIPVYDKRPRKDR